jgi:hypothetical protein
MISVLFSDAQRRWGIGGGIDPINLLIIKILPIVLGADFFCLAD